MPLSPVSDRIKEFPGQALRAVFAGVGQLLLAADKVREQLSGSGDAPAQQTDQAAEPAAVAAPTTAAASQAAASPAAAASPEAAPEAPDPSDSRWRSLDQTGNVRLIGDDDEEQAPAAGTPAAAADEPTAPEPPAAEVAEPAPADAPEPAPADAALPVLGYDQLSVASLRARLRVLDTGQVQTLLDYEKAHEGRTAVITMFERRIAKLEEGS
jgi:hypothetical protein